MKSNNKRNLLLLLLVFILPVVMAYLALTFDWFNKAATNKGELLQPLIQAQTLLSESPNTWQLMYIVPAVCNAECENAIYSVQQTQTATGKESDRVSVLFLTTDDSASNGIAAIKKIANAKTLHTDSQSISSMFAKTDTNSIFIVDTLHNVVLRYPTTSDRQQAILDSRDILADLKKLLKLSRIG